MAVAYPIKSGLVLTSIAAKKTEWIGAIIASIMLKKKRSLEVEKPVLLIFLVKKQKLFRKARVLRVVNHQNKWSSMILIVFKAWA